jgi:predicted aspartyl protease
MSMFKKKVRVSNTKKPEVFFQEEFWVDTGALYSFVAEDYLQRIGVEPAATRNLVLADGRQQAMLLGFCDFQIEGLEGNIPCPVIFAPQGSLFLLGATALENFGVEVDPINKRLKPILAVIGGFLASSITQDVTALAFAQPLRRSEVGGQRREGFKRS